MTDTPTTTGESDVEIRNVLVTGATGYIGGRLVPELLAAGYTVRCLARTPSKLTGRPWSDDIEVVKGDVLDAASVHAAMEGMDAAYHLVHSMDGKGDFAGRDRTAARNMREGAAAAGVKQLVYLGGLGDQDDDLSEHLSSRQDVGRELADGPVPLTELRAAVIIGSGSASFEMLRNLTEVLPVMVTPKWVRTRCQPIAVRDMLAYLVGILGRPEAMGRVLEVGGPEVLTYEEMMHLYTKVAGLRRRRFLRIPLLTPHLSSLWVGLVTPLPVGLAQPLVESLSNEVVQTDNDIRRIVPRDLLGMETAFQLALRRIQDLDVMTTWAGADLPDPHRDTPRTDFLAEEPLEADPDWSGGTVLSDEQAVWSEVASPDDVFTAAMAIGGDRGYPAANWMWTLRGWLDVAVGGVGLRRGRRHPDVLVAGDALDFWRAEVVDTPHLLRLHAEMKLPGEAWLEFHVAEADGGVMLEQRARFLPRGLWGRVYWYLLLPFHALIFPRMARAIMDAAEARQSPPGRTPRLSRPAAPDAATRSTAESGTPSQSQPDSTASTSTPDAAR